MKIQPCLFTAAALLAATLAAAPLTETTAIHVQPDAATPAIGYLKAGTEPAAAPNVTAPEGWMAVALPGPHEAFVSNNDLSKGLNVHPGAALRLLPKADGPVLTTMQEGDQIEITGLRPGWTQVTLSRDVIGYIRIGGPTAAPAAASPPAAMPPPPAAVPGLPAPISVAGGGPAALPHTYQGILVATRRILLVGPRPDYDYQLNGIEGKRIAFLDVSKVLATEKMEKYLDSPVSVSGVLRQAGNGRDLVIEVETLALQ